MISPVGGGSIPPLPQVENLPVKRAQLSWSGRAGLILFAAAAAETRLFDWVAPEATLEEPIELAGAICLLAYALLVAGRHGRGEALIRSAI